MFYLTLNTSAVLKVVFRVLQGVYRILKTAPTAGTPGFVNHLPRWVPPCVDLNAMYAKASRILAHFITVGAWRRVSPKVVNPITISNARM